MEKVHKFVGIHLRAIVVAESLLSSFGFQLALQDRERLLVPGKFVAGSREPGTKVLLRRKTQLDRLFAIRAGPNGHHGKIARPWRRQVLP